MSNRIEEEEAKRRYPSEQSGTKGMIDSGRRKIFSEGAEWMCSEISNCVSRWIIDNAGEYGTFERNVDVQYLAEDLKRYILNNYASRE